MPAACPPTLPSTHAAGWQGAMGSVCLAIMSWGLRGRPCTDLVQGGAAGSELRIPRLPLCDKRGTPGTWNTVEIGLLSALASPGCSRSRPDDEGMQRLWQGQHKLTSFASDNGMQGLWRRKRCMHTSFASCASSARVASRCLCSSTTLSYSAWSSLRCCPFSSILSCSHVIGTAHPLSKLAEKLEAPFWGCCGFSPTLSCAALQAAPDKSSQNE